MKKYYESTDKIHQVHAAATLLNPTERVFSSSKKLITPERNALGDDLIEALECLKAWWDNGLVKRE